MHFTHVDNLPRIAKAVRLLADNGVGVQLAMNVDAVATGRGDKLDEGVESMRAGLRQQASAKTRPVFLCNLN